MSCYWGLGVEGLQWCRVKAEVRFEAEPRCISGLSSGGCTVSENFES